MKTLTIKLLLLLSTLVLTASCSQKAETATEAIKFVKTERVADYLQNEKLVFNGEIKEKSLTTLSFRVAGPISELKVATGDFVEKGQVIAAIDQRDYQLNLQSAKAQYDQIKGEYARYKELFAKGKVPANSYEKVESGYNLAEANYNAAKNSLRDTELKAPFTGYIYQKFTENFQTVGAGHPIVSMIDVSELEVEIAVAENLLKAAQKSQVNLLDVENASVSQIPVKMISISEKAEKDGLFTMKFGLKNADSLNIAPGMSAMVTMYCNSPKQHTQISTSALFHQNNTSFVWVYNKQNGTIIKRKVQTGAIRSNGKIEIISGLNTNETIVTAGVNTLYDNQKVQPIQKPSATNIGGLL